MRPRRTSTRPKPTSLVTPLRQWLKGTWYRMSSRSTSIGQAMTVARSQSATCLERTSCTCLEAVFSTGPCVRSVSKKIRKASKDGRPHWKALRSAGWHIEFAKQKEKQSHRWGTSQSCLDVHRNFFWIPSFTAETAWGMFRHLEWSCLVVSRVCAWGNFKHVFFCNSCMRHFSHEAHEVSMRLHEVHRVKWTGIGQLSYRIRRAWGSTAEVKWTCFFIFNL